MADYKISPETSVEELAVRGLLSQRALKVLQRAHLLTVRDIAVYHSEDARYLALGGCGLKTRREFNQLIKDTYGTLKVDDFGRNGSWGRSKAKSEACSWQEQWLADNEAVDEIESMTLFGVAAELERAGKLSPANRRFYVKCRKYAAFIREQKGIPRIVSDLTQHRWFLAQSTAKLSKNHAALFEELCEEIGFYPI